MTGLLGFEKEDFTSIVDVGAAVFQLMSELAFYDGSDDASGVHSVDRDVGRNKVVSERRKQAIREYYETEDEDEARNTEQESRDSCAEGRRSSTWARQESDLDDSLSTYETTNAPFLTQRGHSRNVSFGRSKQPKQKGVSRRDFVVIDPGRAKDEKTQPKESVAKAPGSAKEEKQAKSTTVEASDTGKKLYVKTAALKEVREEQDKRSHTTEPRVADEASSAEQSKSSRASSTKQVNPKVVLEVKMSSSNHSRTMKMSSSNHSRTMKMSSSNHSRTIDRTLDSMPETSKKGKAPKKILMRRAQAKIAKFNAENERSKNEATFKVINIKTDQDSIEKKSEASSMSNSDVQGTISIKSQSSNSMKQTAPKPAPGPPPPPIDIPERISFIPKEESRDFPPSKVLVTRPGIVSERAAMWQRQCKAKEETVVVNAKWRNGRNDTRQGAPGREGMDYDEYVKKFKAQHKRERNFAVRPGGTKQSNMDESREGV